MIRKSPGYPQSYPHVLHTYRGKDGRRAVVVLTGHVDHGALLGCGCCSRLLAAGFSLYTRAEASATFGIDPHAAGSGSSRARLLVSIHGDDGEALELAVRTGGAPFKPGCILGTAARREQGRAPPPLRTNHFRHRVRSPPAFAHQKGVDRMPIPPGGFAGFAQMAPASRIALSGGAAKGVRRKTRNTRNPVGSDGYYRAGRASARRAKSTTTRRKKSRKKSSGRMKFGSPAWQKKYRVGKFAKKR